jgi:hypothetical protein
VRSPVADFGSFEELPFERLNIVLLFVNSVGEGVVSIFVKFLDEFFEVCYSLSAEEFVDVHVF